MRRTRGRCRAHRTVSPICRVCGTIAPSRRWSDHADLAGKEFFTDEEAAAFEQESVARQDKDRRTEDGLSVQADVGAAYNEVWWDDGKNLTEDNRTALIVDPPDGRIPYMAALVPCPGPTRAPTDVATSPARSSPVVQGFVEIEWRTWVLAVFSSHTDVW